MDGGYQGTYQNGSVREADFQRLAQNIGTNIQKILQNGEKHTESNLVRNQGELGTFGGPSVIQFPSTITPWVHVYSNLLTWDFDCPKTVYSELICHVDQRLRVVDFKTFYH